MADNVALWPLWFVRLRVRSRCGGVVRDASIVRRASSAAGAQAQAVDVARLHGVVVVSVLFVLPARSALVYMGGAG